MKNIKTVIAIVLSILAAVLVLRVSLWLLGLVFSLVWALVIIVFLALVSTPIYFYIRKKLLK